MNVRSINRPIVRSTRIIALVSLGFLFSTEAASLDFVVSRVAPIYPPEAVSKGTEGHVVLRLTVNTEGNVTDVSILDSVPDGMFEPAAKKAALLWHFTPKCGQQFPKNFEVNDTIYFKMATNIEQDRSTVLAPLKVGRPKLVAVETSGGLVIRDQELCSKK